MDLAVHIERREYKYLVDGATAAGIRQSLRPFCQVDPYAAKMPGKTYIINSLYFDNDMYALYQANLREQMDRFKMRIRCYPQHDGGPVFLEVKRRRNDVVSKTRGRLPVDLLPGLMNDPGARIPAAITGANRDAVERFLALSRTYALKPVAMVRYEREPYSSVVDDYARVTFDHHICSKRWHRLSMDGQGRGWRYMDHAEIQKSPAPLTLVEFKFTSATPRWMVNIIQRFDLLRGAFSKYGSSILTWHLPVTPRGPSL